jgi:hypothetical protein
MTDFTIKLENIKSNYHSNRKILQDKVYATRSVSLINADVIFFVILEMENFTA